MKKTFSPRDAVRAIRKRLQTQVGRNNQTVLYTLTVLETCVKNCDRRLLQLVMQREFCQELIKLIGPKNDPPQVVQERVLGLVQVGRLISYFTLIMIKVEPSIYFTTKVQPGKPKFNLVVIGFIHLTGRLKWSFIGLDHI